MPDIKEIKAIRNEILAEAGGTTTLKDHANKRAGIDAFLTAYFNETSPPKGLSVPQEAALFAVSTIASLYRKDAQKLPTEQVKAIVDKHTPLR